MASDPAQALGLSGQVTVVTGGTRGVGLGIARRFADAGAVVFVFGRNAPDPESSVGAFVPCDVRYADSVDRAFRQVEDAAGGVDVLVSNAGGAPPAAAASASPRFHAAIVDLNLTAALHCAQRARVAMAGRPEAGRIVHVASTAGLRPAPTVAAYGAAKAGLLSLTRSLAVEWAPDVRVNAVAPGPVRTESTPLHYPDPAMRAAAEAKIPLGRFAEPEEVGDACLFLASSLARYVTGATILLHGGADEAPDF